jgi:hypothetical protein
VTHLPLFYNPGPIFTVDEQFMPFRGRCLIRQYIPSEPTTYGIKIWAACDAASSYAWKNIFFHGTYCFFVITLTDNLKIIFQFSTHLILWIKESSMKDKQSNNER